MRLMKLFNFKYLIQNLKKSKGALAVFVGLVPLLNFLIYLVSSINTKGVAILSLKELSGVNILGAFIIPVILSYSLFGFLFKKKSVDFVCSMPINRKTIFVSNTIGGIAIIAIMHLLNTILLMIVSSLFGGFLFPAKMVIDYLILWTVSYVFIFIVMNLSIILSGNMITAIVLSCLICFLIPFLRDYDTLKREQDFSNIYSVQCTEKACEPISYYCVDDDCRNNLNNNIYETHMNKIQKSSSHIAPYSFISDYIIYNYSNYKNDFYNPIAILKMVIGAVASFIFGLILLTKRKMECCETSFNSMILHNVIKTLVLVPIYCVILEIITYERIAAIIFIALIIVYYLIYDLITMRKINLKKESTITFLAMSFIVISGITLINYFVNNKSEEIIKVSDIESVAITFTEEDFGEEIFISDKDLINYIMHVELTNYDYKTEDEEELNNFITYSFKTRDGEIYKSQSWVNRKIYSYISNYLTNNKEFINELRTLDKKYTAVTVDNYLYEDKDELLLVIQKGLENTTLENYIEAFSSSNLISEVKLVKYENHDLTYKIIPMGLSKELENIVAKSKNDETIKYLEKKYELYYDKYLHLNGSLYLEEIDNINNDIIIEYLLDYSWDEILAYIKNNQDSVIDMSKEVLIFDIFLNDESFNYITNDKLGIKEILMRKHYQLINTREYNDFLKELESDLDYE